MVQHAQRVVGAILHLDIAVDRGAAHQIERRMQRRQHHRDRIVGAGIDVENQFALCHEREPSVFPLVVDLRGGRSGTRPLAKRCSTTCRMTPIKSTRM